MDAVAARSPLRQCGQGEVRAGAATAGTRRGPCRAGRSVPGGPARPLNAAAPGLLRGRSQ